MYTCICIYLLENPMDQGAWWATFHGVAKSRTWLKWLAPTHIYLSIYLNHFAVHLYLTQHCKATIVQFFKKPNSDSGTCSPWSLEGITAVSCHAIQWRESNLWTGFSWKSKQTKSVSLKRSAWDCHREEPSSGCYEEWQGWIVVFAQVDNQEHQHWEYHIPRDSWRQRHWPEYPHHH